MKKQWKSMSCAALALTLTLTAPMTSLAAANDTYTKPNVSEAAPTTKDFKNAEPVTAEMASEVLADEPNEVTGKWKLDQNGYRYYLNDKEYAVDQRLKIDGYVYAFDKNGYRVSGWYNEEKIIDNHTTVKIYYYFNERDGKMCTGWSSIDNKWYYFDSKDGVMYSKGVWSINGSNFAFSDVGVMLTGWYLDTKLDENNKKVSTWYYFDGSGYGLNGWLLYHNSWYFCENGKMYSDSALKEINGKYYSFASDGIMRTGWYMTPDKNWYYFDNSGAMTTGWLLLGNTWYYLDPATGIMYSNCIQTINGSNYAFSTSGAMITGWHLSGNEWYYFNSSGAGVTDWVLSSGKWYYCEAGKMVKNVIKTIKGSVYGFTADGIMVTGWHLHEGEWYYFNSSGAGITGWLLYNNAWYYIEKGYMLYDTEALIDGKYSAFGKDGIWTGYVEHKEETPTEPQAEQPAEEALQTAE